MARAVDSSDNRITLRRLLRRPKYRYMAANRIVPHLPWLVLIGLSVYLYKTRIFADSGYYVSQFINNKTFWIECQQLVSGIPQILPLIGVWTGLEIKYILLLFSLSHVLFFYFLFLFVYYGLRDRRSGLLIILTQTVGIMYGFFNPMFELNYAVPLLITFYAIWQLPFRFRTIYILLILEALILLSHPFAFILLVYIMLYDYTKKTAKSFKFYIPVALVFIGLLAFRYFVPCDYGSDKYGWLTSYSDTNQFLHQINPAHLKALGMFMVYNYAEVLVAFILVLYMLATRKQWFRIALVMVAFLGFLILAGSAFDSTPSYLTEQMMFPLIPVVFIPLIYGFPLVGRQGLLNISILLISALIAYRLTVIYFASDKFVKRVTQMEQLIEAARKKGGNKFFVSEAITDHGYTLMNWSYPIETMLLSAIDGNDITITIAPENTLHSVTETDDIKADEFIFRNDELKDENWLNSIYFHLDIGPYLPINDPTPNKNINFAANNIRIIIDSKNIYRAMDTVWIPVTILNQGKTSVYSGIKNKVFLSYFWVEKNNVLNWDEIRTPLQTDITGTMKQDIRVAVPLNKGRLQIKVDIIADDNWFGISSQEDVLVY